MENKLIPLIKQLTEQAERKISIVLPFPPSGNQIYRKNPHGPGMYISKEGKNYFKQCQLIAVTKYAGFHTITTDCIAIVNFVPPNNLRRDIDNSMKVLFDALQKNNMLQDDKLIVSAIINKAPADKQNPRSEIIFLPH